VLSFIDIFMAAVMLLRICEVGPRSLDRTIQNRQRSCLTVKLSRIAKVMIRAIRYRRFCEQKVGRFPGYNSEMISSAGHLFNSRHILKPDFIPVKHLKRRSRELSAQLLVDATEQSLRHELFEGALRGQNTRKGADAPAGGGVLASTSRCPISTKSSASR